MTELHEPPPTTERWAAKGSIVVTEAAAWLSAGLLIAFLRSLIFTLHSQWSTISMAVLCCLFGFRVFLKHGRTRITAAGIYSYAFALFIGGAGLYYTLVEQVFGALRPWLFLAIASAYLVQVLTTFGFWTYWRNIPVELADLPVSRSTRNTAVYLGLVMLASAGYLKHLSPPMALSCAYVAVVLVSAPLILSERARYVAARHFVIAGALIVFVRFFHTGSGRLQIAALALAIAIMYAMRFRNMLVKWSVLIATVPSVWWAVQYREDYVKSSYGNEVNGLGSAVRPVLSYAKLLYSYHQNLYSPAGGRTFITPLTSFLPDSILQDKPLAFGYAIVKITEPTLYGTRYSDAGSVFGEWLWNFTPLGLLLMIPVLGVIISRSDLIVYAALRQKRAVLQFVSAAIITLSGLSDFMWAGWHGYAVRTLIRLAVLSPIIIYALWLKPETKAIHEKGGPKSLRNPANVPRT